MSQILSRSIKGIFLLIIAMCGNFVAETLGCQTRRLLTENQLIKHCIIFFTIFFSIDFASGFSSIPDSPVENIGLTLIIYVFFVLFTRMDLVFTGIVFILLTIIYFINSYITYLKAIKDISPTVNILEQLEYVLMSLLGPVVIIGFIYYLLRQRKDHAKNWSSIKFIFGISKCSH